MCQITTFIFYYQKSSTICAENCIFLFSLNQLRPKLDSKFCGRNLETRESPNHRKYPILCNILYEFPVKFFIFLCNFYIYSL